MLSQCFLARLGANLGEGLDDCLGLNAGAQLESGARAAVAGALEAFGVEHLEWLSQDFANLVYSQSEKGAAAAHVAIARWAIS